MKIYTVIKVHSLTKGLVLVWVLKFGTFLIFPQELKLEKTVSLVKMYLYLLTVLLETM